MNRKSRLTSSVEEVQQQISKIDKTRRVGQLRPDERRLILRVFFGLYQDNNDRTPRQNVNSQIRTAKLLGVGKNTVARVVSEWTKAVRDTNSNDSLLESVVNKKSQTGYHTNQVSRVPKDDETFYLIRDFITQKRVERTRICATDVLSFLLDNKILSMSTNCTGVPETKEYKAALVCVQRYLKKRGFLRGKRKSKVEMSAKNIAWRNMYLRTLLENRKKPRSQSLREVYTDESYVHHHHHNAHNDLYHPSRLEETEKIQHKGRRYCFVAAIGGSGINSSPGMIENSKWVFCPTSRKSHKGDYHKVFDRNNYVKWFSEQLIPNLHEPSLIILDNAKYHKCKPKSVGVVSKLKKDQVLDILDKITCNII